MINPALLKSPEGLETIRESLKRRNTEPDTLASLQKITEERSSLNAEVENLQSRRNSSSKEIGRLKAAGDEEGFEKARAEMKNLSDDIKNRKERLEEIENSYNDLLLSVPNILDQRVPEGKDESDNKLIREYGEKPLKPAAHYDICEKYNLYDSERAAKISGSRFIVYNDTLARLERRVIDFMLERHRSNGYAERNVPLLVNDEAMRGTGQYPKFKDEYYRADSDALSLIPTAEVPLTNLHADEILSEDELTLKLTAASSCFRREAGAAGRDTRGLIRLHQFQKVELVKFTHPEKSAEELESLTADAEDILKKLGLSYRVVLLCAGDTSFSSSMTYDLEVWMPGMQRYLEISSCSNFRDFQARRAMIRYRDHGGKNHYLHTLNGSGVAAGRLLAALLETYQNEDGSPDFEKIENLIRI